MDTSRKLQELKDALSREKAAPGWPRDVHLKQEARGRQADQPTDIPKEGWKDILLRSWREISAQNLFLIAGGVTYAALLALFPGLAALVSLYGLAFDATQIEQQLGAFVGVVPAEMRDLLTQQLHSLTSAPHHALGLAAITGVILAVWSASRGMSGLISALNIAYEEEESRSFVKFNALALLMTLGLLASGIIVTSLIAVLPVALKFLPLGQAAKWAIFVVEWPVLIGFVLSLLAILYRYAPNRDEPKWRWVSPGAITATFCWILASLGFTIYVGNFNSYDKTYGSLGGVIILLTWMYISTLMILFGAVMNAQSERQTRRDSTEGKPQPMGTRRARAADTLGETAGE